MKVYLIQCLVVSLLSSALGQSRGVDIAEEHRREYRIMMESYLNGSEFSGVLKSAMEECHLTGTNLQFYMAGYVRGWLDYRNYSAISGGIGLGKINPLSGGVAQYEHDGWVAGCQKAATKGRAINETVTARLIGHLKNSENSETASGSQPIPTQQSGKGSPSGEGKSSNNSRSVPRQPPEGQPPAKPGSAPK